MDKAVVFYSDILGFTEHLKNEEDFDNTLSVLKDAIVKALNMINALSAVLAQEEFRNLLENYHYRLFSDNLYVSFKYEVKNNETLKLSTMLILLSAKFYQYALLAKSVYIRGGISYGSDYFDEHIIFSKALVNAYKLESEVSIYPRIVIEKKLVEIFLSEIKEVNSNSLIEKSIVKDWSNIYFINPYSVEAFWREETGKSKDEWISVVPNEVVKQCDLQLSTLDSETNYKIFQKIKWLKDFTNWFLDNSKNNLGFEYII